MGIFARLSRARRTSDSLPGYVFWEFRGHAWGEAAWSVLHRQPIRSFIIPQRAHKLLNLWGPNGWLQGSRFGRH